MEIQFYCARCEKGTPGEKFCESCGLIRPITGLVFCPNCNGATVGEEFCKICGMKRTVQQILPPKEIPVSSFKIEISRRLFFDEETGKKSQALSDEYKNVDAAVRKFLYLEKTGSKTDIKDFSGELATRYPFVWDDLSDFEKTTMRADGRIPGTMDGIQQHGKKILDELGKLNRPLRDLVITILEEVIPKALASRRMNVVKRLERGMLVLHNFKSCELVFDRLVEFKKQVRQMMKLSLSEIVGSVKAFEKEVNEINTTVLIEEEVSVEKFQNFRRAIA